MPPVTFFISWLKMVVSTHKICAFVVLKEFKNIKFN